MHRLETSLRVAASALVLLVVAIWAWQEFAPEAGSPRTARATGEPAEGAGQEWDVVSVIDGDTLIARRDGVVESVRLLVIDAPEREQCGYDDARDALVSLVEGRTVVLVPGSPDDRDQYGRLLRYVEVAVDGETVDAGERLLELGLAAAIYDSRIGFPRHDREAEYIAADDAAPDLCPDMREH